MRDKNRIDKFCSDLATEWKKYPDFRFGQMMLNIFGEMFANGRDPFFPEEEEMMKCIKDYMKKFAKEDN